MQHIKDSFENGVIFIDLSAVNHPWLLTKIYDYDEKLLATMNNMILPRKINESMLNYARSRANDKNIGMAYIKGVYLHLCHFTSRPTTN